MTTLRDQLRPQTLEPIQKLVHDAKVDVSDWAVGKNGQTIAENQNAYRNFLWAFGGGKSEPVVLCIWHEEIDWDCDPPRRVGNAKRSQEELNALADESLDSRVRQRIATKVARSQLFAKLVRQAFLHTKPVRVVLVDGTRAFGDDAAEASSEVDARALDPETWWVHKADPESGDFEVLRGLRPTKPPIPDPYDDVDDPGLDPRFQEFVSTLSETEREAMIKQRVGQGRFRDGLLVRWKRQCALTKASVPEMLIASHIKPWSLCQTPSERLGDSNGLLLAPSIDKAFDRGLITFDDRFQIIIKPKLLTAVLAFGLTTSMRLNEQSRGADLLPFLRWHRQHFGF